jgi:hypothetical protein
MSRWLFSSMLTTLAATALAAQGPAVSIQPPNPVGASQQSVTLSGCVGAGQTAAAPFTLSNATRLGPTTVPEPSTVSPPPATSSTGAPSVTTGTTGAAAGATGTTGATGTAGAAGTTGTMTGGGTTSTAGVAGTAGVSTLATAGVPGLPPSTYQLSGTSVGSYVGQSVQVTGMLVPSPNVAATSGASSSGVTRPTGGTDVVGATPPTTTPVLPEFRVVRVEPLGIRCPQ